MENDNGKIRCIFTYFCTPENRDWFYDEFATFSYKY